MRSQLKKSLMSLLRFQPFRKILHRLFFLSLQAESPSSDLCEYLFLLSIKAEPPSKKICYKFASYIETMELHIQDQLVDELWQKIEPVYINSRRKLLLSRKWRYGPLFVRDNAKPVFDKLAKHNISIEGKVYCDLGCGIHHPYGTSAVMYINGSASTIAIDIQDTDQKRAAEALYDLLQDCLINPDSWHWSSLTREEYLTRIQSFNLKALSEGDLESGIAPVPLKYITTNIYEPTIPLGTIDIMSSRAVLEHFLEFEMACRKLWELMSPGGIAYHLIDLVDHRAYSSPKYHWWSFLAEDEQWSDGLCNRLRASEIREYLERTGFAIISYDVVNKAELPIGFRQQLKGRFALMSDEELKAIRISCLLEKN